MKPWIVLLGLALALTGSMALIMLGLGGGGGSRITASIIDARGECGLGERKLWLIGVEDGYALLGYS